MIWSIVWSETECSGGNSSHEEGSCQGQAIELTIVEVVPFDHVTATFDHGVDINFVSYDVSEISNSVSPLIIAVHAIWKEFVSFHNVVSCNYNFPMSKPTKVVIII